MKERTPKTVTIKEKVFYNHSTDVKTKEIELSPTSSDKSSRFLYDIQREFRRGLNLYSKEAKKGKHGQPKGARVLRDERSQYPKPEEMSEVLFSLSGKSENTVVVFIKDDAVVGFDIEKPKKEDIVATKAKPTSA